jgi:hypothetical protein
LLVQLSDGKFDLTSPEVRDNTLQFYSEAAAAIVAKKDLVRLHTVLASLDELGAAVLMQTRRSGSSK